MRTRPAGARATGGAQTGGGETVACGGVWARAAAGTDDETAAASIEIFGKVLNRCMWKPRPNGSRLSCGRNARRRKAVQRQKQRLAGEATQFLPTCERPAASSACWAAGIHQQLHVGLGRGKMSTRWTVALFGMRERSFD